MSLTLAMPPAKPRVDPLGPRRRIVIIRNPTAGAAATRLSSRVIKALEKAGAQVMVWETERAGDAKRLAGLAGPEQFDIVVVAGGDGTINEVVNGLSDSSLPMAILPTGTANVVAREIALPRQSKRIAQAILTGTARPIYLGRANDRRFVMMAGIGFDAHVVAHNRLWLKRYIGPGSYVVGALVAAFAYRYRRYQVRVDDTRYRAYSVVVANGRYYGGGFSCAPAACLHDRHLYACLFQRAGPLIALGYLFFLALGRLDRAPGVTIVPGERIEIDGVSGEAVQCDGDVVARLPVVIQSDPATIRCAFPG